MVLVNGADGIGTGWSTSIPNYNPRDIVDNLHHLMNGEEQEPMTPWYKGFTGTIEPHPKKKGSFNVKGRYTVVDDHNLEIFELPLGTWTNKVAIECLLNS